MPFEIVNNNTSSNNLNKVYKTHNCVVFYYWNSCGHCQRFLPIFNDVIYNLRHNEKDFMNRAQIFQIEFEDFNLLPDELKEIQAFPSVITYSNGEKVKEFNQQRTSENLKDFIMSSIGEPSITYKPSTSSGSRRKRVIKKYPKSV